MISEELKSIVDVISNQGKMLFFDGVTEEQINQFEAETMSSSQRNTESG